jgi:hypothetical protein
MKTLKGLAVRNPHMVRFDFKCKLMPKIGLHYWCLIAKQKASHVLRQMLFGLMNDIPDFLSIKSEWFRIYLTAFGYV